MSDKQINRGGRPRGSSWGQQYLQTLGELTTLIADPGVSPDRKAELMLEKSQLVRAAAERQGRHEIHERHKQKQQRRRLREGPPAPDPPPQGVPLTTAQIVELMRRGSLQAAPSAQNRVEQ